MCRHTCAAQKRKILTCHCGGECIAQVHRMWTRVTCEMCVTTCMTLSTYSFLLHAGETIYMACVQTMQHSPYAVPYLLGFHAMPRGVFRLEV